jgi:hypothetical protein
MRDLEEGPNGNFDDGTEADVAVIRELYERICGGTRRMVDDAIRIGEVLTNRKLKCGGHGNWLPWVKANWPYSERSMNRFFETEICAIKFFESYRRRYTAIKPA